MPASRRNVYLDHSASTPADPRVVEAMLPYFSEIYGNSSSMHNYGRKAEQAIETSRETMARVLNCQPSEIIFTSGGSESDNLAIRGVAWAKRAQGDHLITTPVEHEAVKRTVHQLAVQQGFRESLLPVDPYGRVDSEDLAAAIQPTTTLTSIIYVNNEVGSINPLPQLAAQAHERGVLLHTDAVQAAGQLTLDVQTLGVDLLSLSAHKFYGPKGVGALYVRNGITLDSAQTGGSHENGRRAGTHNTPFIVGMAKALELAYTEREIRVAHYTAMRTLLIEGILSRVPDSQLTGHPDERLPSHASFVFADVDSNQLLMSLDMKGIAASSGSACKTGNPEPSGVLLAMGYPRELASSSLRLSVGLQTTEEDIEYVINAITDSIAKLRKLSKSFAN